MRSLHPTAEASTSLAILHDPRLLPVPFAFLLRLALVGGVLALGERELDLGATLFVEMDVEGKRFASGVSDAAGVVPRFGEAVVSVPVSISMYGIARQAMSMIGGEVRGKLAYEMGGKLAGPGFGSVRFHTRGELTLPRELSGPAR